VHGALYQNRHNQDRGSGGSSGLGSRTKGFLAGAGVGGDSGLLFGASWTIVQEEAIGTHS